MNIQFIRYWLYYAWRVVGTGISFSLFGIGGPIIAVSLGLYLNFTTRSAEEKCVISRNAIRGAFKLYILFMQKSRLLTYEVKGFENIPQSGELLIANHPSLLDVVFLVSIVPGANCIVKESLIKNIFTRLPIGAAKFIQNNASDLVERCAASLKKEATLIIFPEGTRTTPGEALNFQRGAANIALHCGSDISPVLIDCTPPTLIKHQAWYNVPPTPPHFTITFDKKISIREHIKSDLPQCKSARKLTRELEGYFSQRILDTQPSRITAEPANSL